MNQKEINATEIESILNLEGRFYWSFGKNWLIVTDKGNFHWSDSSYGGAGTITATKETLKDWLERINETFVRDKGQHLIRKYCGRDVQVILT